MAKKLGVFLVLWLWSWDLNLLETALCSGAFHAWAVEIKIPQRAISQVPSITEILFALGQGERLVGVSRFCRFPPEAQQKPKVGGLHDPDLERILALQPDWIALFKGQEKVGEILSRQGCTIYYCSVETIAETYSVIEDLGHQFQVEEAAKALVTSISKEIADLRQRLSQLPRKRVLYVVGREPGSLKQLYGVGKGTFLAEMLAIAGGEICLSPSLGRYPVLSREAILLANPEVILDADASFIPAASGAAPTIPPEWESLASVTAVRNRNVKPIDDPQITIPGTFIPDTIRKLAILLHGEAARKVFAET